MHRFLHRIFLAAIFLGTLWAAGFIWFVTAIPNQVDDASTPTDAIVVLTGGKGRLPEGLALLKEEKAKKLLISGVGEKSTINDLHTLSKEIEPGHIKPFEDRIVLGHMAYSTQTNAIETSIWMEFEHYKSLRLVTANYHIPRSMAQFRAEMPDVQIIPHPVVSQHVKLAWWKFPASARLLFEEYNKFLAVQLAVMLPLHIAPLPK